MKKYPVITLCGSTRFKDEYIKKQKELTLSGNIVISVGLFGHSGDSEIWESMNESILTKTKEMLDDMHKAKIDMSDSIYVINKDGYIDDSTMSEIAYAVKNNKTIDYLDKDETRICPVCNKYYFSEKNSYEICPVCGWEDDPVQRKNPDFRGGANDKSLNVAISEYLAGGEEK